MYAKIIDLKVGDRVRNSRLGEGVVIKALGIVVVDDELVVWDEEELMVSYAKQSSEGILTEFDANNPYCLQYYADENDQLELIPSKPRHQRIPTKYQP